MNTQHEFVYFTSDISSCGLLRIYSILNFNAIGKTAIKVHSGELGGKYFVNPQIIRGLVDVTHGTIVDSNTPFNGIRSTTSGHLRAMEENGFRNIAECDVLDSEGSIAIPVPCGKRLNVNYVGSHLPKYNSIIIVTHFKGHKSAGFGGVLKDMSIGLASKEGKCWIHTAGKSRQHLNNHADQIHFFESMVDSASSIIHLGIPIVYISLLNNISVDGDSCPNPRIPQIGDKGILASYDPVALDQACIDLIRKDAKIEIGSKYDLIERIDNLKGEYIFSAATNMGIGNRSYNLVNIDDNIIQTRLKKRNSKESNAYSELDGDI